MITMTRRLTFSAAYTEGLQSTSPEMHGHNYILDVSVDGEIDPKTGVIVNIKDIDQIAKEHVIGLLDKKFINRQVPEFRDCPVTAENLTAFIAKTLIPYLPPAVTLSALRLEETPLGWVEWKAREETKETETMYITRTYEFAASHRLDSPYLTPEENQALFGKCNNVYGHGHNYIVEVTVVGPVEARTGHVVDTDRLDEVVHKEVIDRYDHRHFNFDIPEFEGLIPSAEVITQMIWERLQGHIPAPARLHRILLRETARNIFEYYGEEKPTT